MRRNQRIARILLAKRQLQLQQQAPMALELASDQSESEFESNIIKLGNARGQGRSGWTRSSLRTSLGCLVIYILIV